MNYFLRAKHWQIFALTYGLPMLLNLFMVPILFISRHPVITIELLLSAILSFGIGGYLAWLWAVAVGLHVKIPVNYRQNLIPFKTSILLIMVYLLAMIRLMIFICESVKSLLMLLISLIGAIFGGKLDDSLGPDSGFMDIFLRMIIPLQIISIFCMFYCIYITAKTFKSAQLQRSVAFSDFVGEFFLTLFFPVGVWIIQPQINKMVKDDSEFKNKQA